MFEANDIYECVSVMFIIAKLLGYTSFGIKKDKFVFSKFGVAYPTFICIVYIGFSAYDIYTREREDHSEIYHIIETVNVHSFSVTTLIIMFSGIYYQKQTVKLLESLCFFDNEISNRKPISSMKLSYRYSKKHVVITCVIFHFFSLSLLIEDIVCFFPLPFEIIKLKFAFTYCIPLFACNSFILELNILLSLLTTRYKWINKELFKLQSKFNMAIRPNVNIYEVDKADQYDNNRNNYVEKVIHGLEDIRRYYDILHTITQKFNCIYAIRIVIQVYQILISLITNLLFFAKQQGASANRRKQSISYILIMIEVMLMNIYEIISMCIYSMKLCNEAKRTPQMLHGIKNSEEVDEYIKVFSNQLLHSKVNILGYHMFSLNISLLFSLVAQAASYLIICVQLEIPDK